MEEINIQPNWNNKSIEELIDLTLLTKFEFDTWLSKSFKKNMEISIVAKKVSQKINI